MTFSLLPILLISTAFSPSNAFHPFPPHSITHPPHPTKNSLTKLGVSWSNGQAIQEYQDFLSGKSQNLNDRDDGPSLIITGNPDAANDNNNLLLDALLKLNPNNDDIVIRPGDPLPATVAGRDEFPIYVTAPPSQLSSILSSNLSNNWDAKRDDLVFFTTDKGNVEEVLRRYGLVRDGTTQVLACFSTPGAVLAPQDLSVTYGLDAAGEGKKAMETVTCGKWRDAIAKRLEGGGIGVKRMFHREWRRHMWEKTVFDAAFHLIGAIREEKTTVWDVAEYYGDEVEEMVWQLSGLLRGAMAVTLTYGFEERMFEYALKMGKESVCEISDETFAFTNEVFLDYSSKGLKAGFGDPAPMHTEYVAYAVDVRGLLKTVTVPDTNVEQTRKTIMRQGNLRADGVV
eukprot:CAMPEP_0172515594 /NCGR_PEP_ID=MMETSP1066-20121228/269288_1 /TAXON_ID=671091 /ORGANISM="Coscinodiscus wailesii, Strain CCMP2513" /LENGTH=398 /DNA_ID=CAMNT_0013296709 /DNA_START=119 /DNA_END=1315 /DNA_ORIENTATION=+